MTTASRPAALDRLRGVSPRLVLALVAVIAVICAAVLTHWQPWRFNRSILADGWGGLAGAVAAVVWAAAPIIALRRPVMASVLAMVPLVVVTGPDAERGWPITMFVALLGVAAVSIWDDPRLGWVLGAYALAPLFTTAVGVTRLQLPFGTQIQAPGGTSGIWMLVVWALVVAATLVVVRRTRAGALARDGLRRRSVEVEQESAVLAERARLARDLHDVVAHHVSLIAVRAETAPYTLVDLPPSARAVLREIADDSRRALDELRGVLGVLRRSADDPALAPQPGAVDVALLVDQAWSAGEQVEWTPRDLSEVDDAVGYVGYRVVQELLTNARRHAPGLALSLETEPLPGGGLWVRSVNPAAWRERAVAHGRGLTGMTERVRALGGTIQIEADSGAGFVVEVALPGPRPRSLVHTA